MEDRIEDSIHVNVTGSREAGGHTDYIIHVERQGDSWDVFKRYSTIVTWYSELNGEVPSLTVKLV